MSPKAKFLQKRINQIKEMNLRVIVMRMKILKKKNQKNVKRHQKTINLKKILFEMKIQTSKIIKNWQRALLKRMRKKKKKSKALKLIKISMMKTVGSSMKIRKNSRSTKHWRFCSGSEFPIDMFCLLNSN